MDEMYAAGECPFAGDVASPFRLQQHAYRRRESLTLEEWRAAQARALSLYPGEFLSASGDPEDENHIRTAIAVADILDNPSLRPLTPDRKPSESHRLRTVGHGPAHPAGKASRELGRALRAWRERQSLSQRELAKRLGWEQPHVARLEAGLHTPNLATLDRVARRLGLEVTVCATPENLRVELHEPAR